MQLILISIPICCMLCAVFSGDCTGAAAIKGLFYSGMRDRSGITAPLSLSSTLIKLGEYRYASTYVRLSFLLKQRTCMHLQVRM